MLQTSYFILNYTYYIDSYDFHYFLCFFNFVGNLYNSKMNGIIAGLGIPIIGTVLGAACVFFIKDKINPYMNKVMLGFAAGIMVAASIWSLLIPAMEM